MKKKSFLFLFLSISVIGFFGFTLTQNSLCPKKGISGKVIAFSKCKNEDEAKTKTVALADNLSRVDYSFSSADKKLSIKHINAAFNCCPDSIYCKVSYNKDTIIIEEFQKTLGCRCNCLYDVDIVLNNVKAKPYYVRFVEPYCNDQKKICFPLDLTKTTKSTFTVEREKYPWASENQK